MSAHWREWISFAGWLDDRRVESLRSCTSEHWRAYVHQRVRDGMDRDRTERLCSRLTNLWAFDQLSARPVGIARPPWESEGIDGFLPATTVASGGENTTEPLDPQVLGPLLIWAIRMVDDFAGDILAAGAERRRLIDRSTISNSAAGQAALEDFLRPALTTGAALPSTWHMGKQTLAVTYLAGRTGASIDQITKFSKAHGISALAAQRPGPCPLEVPVTRQLDRTPWREHVDFTEVPELMQQLGTAAIIICLYLTGMRPQEVQSLRSGCCPDPTVTGRYLIAADPGQADRDGEDGVSTEPPGPHLIRGHHYKNVTDEDGNHVSASEVRAVPWVAITPVVRAIRVLERIVPDGELLFSSTHHDFPRHRPFHGALKISALNKRIESFVAWANREAHRQGLDDQAIPEDPHGAIGLTLSGAPWPGTSPPARAGSSR